MLIEWFKASKKDIPAKLKKSVSAAVYPKYISQRRFAVSVILG